jgi:hypothetical protein
MMRDTSEQALKKLKDLGVEVTFRPKSGKIVVARVSAEKLKSLAAMDEVKYIAPV